MEHFECSPKGVCPVRMSFDLDGDKVRNVSFIGGCSGNLKAIGKLVEGMSASELNEKLRGNTCGFKRTSCADQLAKAVSEAAGI